MNKFTQYSLRAFMALTALPVAGTALAQISEGELPTGVKPIEGSGTGALTQSILTIIVLIINILLGIAGALAAAYLVYAGIQYIQGGKGVDTARQSIINAVTGIIIIILAFVIVNTVISVGTGAGA